MVIYVSAETKAQGGIYSDPKYVVDTSIQSSIPNQVNAPSPPATQPSAPPQQPPQLSNEDKQRILMQQGLAYGNPDAPQYQQIFRNVQAQPSKDNNVVGYYYELGDNLSPLEGTVASASVPTAESYNRFLNPIETTEPPPDVKTFLAGRIIESSSLPTGVEKGTPWNLEVPDIVKMRENFFSQADVVGKEGISRYASMGISAVAIPSFDEITGKGDVGYKFTGITDEAKLRSSPLAFNADLRVAELQNKGYGIINVKPVIKEGELAYDIAPASAADEPEARKIVQEYKNKGFIVSPYYWTNEKGEKIIKFGEPIRDADLLPLTPYEQVKLETSQFKENMVPFMKTSSPFTDAYSLVVGGKKGYANTVEGKDGLFKGISTLSYDLTLGNVNMFREESAKFYIGGIGSISGNPIFPNQPRTRTKEGAQEFISSPEKQAQYAQLFKEQKKAGQVETAISIAAMGAITIGAEGLSAARYTGKVPLSFGMDTPGFLGGKLPKAGTVKGDLIRMRNIGELGGKINVRYEPTRTGQVMGDITEAKLPKTSVGIDFTRYEPRALPESKETLLKGAIKDRGKAFISLDFQTPYTYPTEKGLANIGSVSLGKSGGYVAVPRLTYAGIVVPKEVLPNEKFNNEILSGVSFKKSGELRIYGIEKGKPSIMKFETEQDVLLGKGKPMGEIIESAKGEIRMKNGIPLYSEEKIKQTSDMGLVFPLYSSEEGQFSKSYFRLGAATMEEQSIPSSSKSYLASKFKKIRGKKLSEGENFIIFPDETTSKGLSIYGELFDESFKKLQDVRLFQKDVQLDKVDLGGKQPLASKYAYVQGTKRGTETRYATRTKTITQEELQEQLTEITIPIQKPVQIPIEIGTRVPIRIPFLIPTQVPVQIPTQIPTQVPMQIPTQVPTQIPIQTPFSQPVQIPTQIPTQVPMQIPTQVPTQIPTQVPTQVPVQTPVQIPVQTPVQTPQIIPKLIPKVPPSIPPIIPPFTFPLNLFGGGSKSLTSAARKRYTPDLTAAFFGIRVKGKAPRENVGFGVQPIFIPKTKPIRFKKASKSTNINLPRAKPIANPLKGLFGRKRRRK